MPKTATAPVKRTPPSKTAAPQSKSKEVAHGEATPRPTDPSADRLQAELDKLSAPGRASKSDAEQIDNDPGYSKDQLAHMREYWGLKESTAEVADT